MVSRSNNEAMLTLLVIQEQHRHDGFHIAFVPHALDAQQIADSLQELGIIPELVFEVGGWRPARHRRNHARVSQALVS